MAADSFVPGPAHGVDESLTLFGHAPGEAEMFESGPEPDPPVRVIRSSRRRKTSSARFVDGVVEVRIPAWMDARQEADTVAELVARVAKAREMAAGELDLVARAARLADEHGLPRPSSIRWVGNQQKRWGSCSQATGEIRISSRLRRVPGYVLDHVIVHELAHLVEIGHGPRFRALEDRFPRRERAEGFLDAMSLGLADDGYRED